MMNTTSAPPYQAQTCCMGNLIIISNFDEQFGRDTSQHRRCARSNNCSLQWVTSNVNEASRENKPHNQACRMILLKVASLRFEQSMSHFGVWVLKAIVLRADSTGAVELVWRLFVKGCKGCSFALV